MEPRTAIARKLRYMLGFTFIIFLNRESFLKFTAKVKQQGQNSHCNKRIS